MQDKMRAVILQGHGDFSQMQYREDVDIPHISADEVLIQVGACGVNNTDINTRVGWYAKTTDKNHIEAGAWNEQPLQFPLANTRA